MDNCVFCKIVSGEIPIMKIFEYEYTIAFMDTAKDVDGHIVVVPKKHVQNILDCDIELMNSLMLAVRKISVHCVKNCGYNGVNLLNASDISAGQSVPHFHFHIIPRKDNDRIDAWPNFTGATKELSEMYEELRMC